MNESDMTERQTVCLCNVGSVMKDVQAPGKLQTLPSSLVLFVACLCRQKQCQKEQFTLEVSQSTFLFYGNQRKSVVNPEDEVIFVMPD